MFDLLIGLIAVVIVLAGIGVYLYRRRTRRRKIIDDILFDVNPLAVWTYSAEEWRRAVDEQFS